MPETTIHLGRRALLYGAIILSTASAGVAEPLSCPRWRKLSSGDQAAALRAGTESSVETVRRIVSGADNEKQILDSLRACLQGVEPDLFSAFEALCASNPDAQRDDFMARMAPISRPCTEEAIDSMH